MTLDLVLESNEVRALRSVFAEVVLRHVKIQDTDFSVCFLERLTPEAINAMRKACNQLSTINCADE